MVTSEESHESTVVRDSCLILLQVLIDMLLKVIGSLAVCGYEVRNRRAVVLSAGQSTRHADCTFRSSPLSLTHIVLELICRVIFGTLNCGNKVRDWRAAAATVDNETVILTLTNQSTLGDVETLELADQSAIGVVEELDLGSEDQPGRRIDQNASKEQALCVSGPQDSGARLGFSMQQGRPFGNAYYQLQYDNCRQRRGERLSTFKGRYDMQLRISHAAGLSALTDSAQSRDFLSKLDGRHDSMKRDIHNSSLLGRKPPSNLREAYGLASRWVVLMGTNIVLADNMARESRRRRGRRNVSLRCGQQSTFSLQTTVPIYHAVLEAVGHAGAKLYGKHAWNIVQCCERYAYEVDIDRLKAQRRNDIGATPYDIDDILSDHIGQFLEDSRVKETQMLGGFSHIIMQTIAADPIALACCSRSKVFCALRTSCTDPLGLWIAVTDAMVGPGEVRDRQARRYRPHLRTASADSTRARGDTPVGNGQAGPTLLSVSQDQLGGGRERCEAPHQHKTPLAVIIEAPVVEMRCVPQLSSVLGEAVRSVVLPQPRDEPTPEPTAAIPQRAVPFLMEEPSQRPVDLVGVIFQSLTDIVKTGAALDETRLGTLSDEIKLITESQVAGTSDRSEKLSQPIEVMRKPPEMSEPAKEPDSEWRSGAVLASVDETVERLLTVTTAQGISDDTSATTWKALLHPGIIASVPVAFRSGVVEYSLTEMNVIVTARRTIQVEPLKTSTGAVEPIESLVTTSLHTSVPSAVIGGMNSHAAVDRCLAVAEDRGSVVSAASSIAPVYIPAILFDAGVLKISAHRISASTVIQSLIRAEAAILGEERSTLEKSQLRILLLHRNELAESLGPVTLVVSTHREDEPVLVTSPCKISPRLMTVRSVRIIISHARGGLSHGNRGGVAQEPNAVLGDAASARSEEVSGLSPPYSPEPSLLRAEIWGEEVNELSPPYSSVSSLLGAEIRGGMLSLTANIRGDEVTELEYDRIRGVIPSTGMKGAIAEASCAVFADVLVGTGAATIDRSITAPGARASSNRAGAVIATSTMGRQAAAVTSWASDAVANESAAAVVISAVVASSNGWADASATCLIQQSVMKITTSAEVASEVSNAIVCDEIADIMDAVDRSTAAGLSDVDAVDWSIAGLSKERASAPLTYRALVPTGRHESAATSQIAIAEGLCDVKRVSRNIISADSPSDVSRGDASVTCHGVEETSTSADQEERKGRIVSTGSELSSVYRDLRDCRWILKDSCSADDGAVASAYIEQDTITAVKQQRHESRIQSRRRSRCSARADLRNCRH